MLIPRYVIFDESSFPFASSDPPPDDLDSLFSFSPAVCPIAPPCLSSITGTSEPVTGPREALTLQPASHVVPAPHAAPTPQPPPRAASMSPPTPRAASASRFTEPPWCISDDIQPPRRSPLTLGHWSTTPSLWLVTPAARTRWSPVMLPGSPSPWIVYSSPPPPLPRHCLWSRPLPVARSRTPTGVALWRSTRP
jgi:hypothetical protein